MEPPARSDRFYLCLARRPGAPPPGPRLLDGLLGAPRGPLGGLVSALGALLPNLLSIRLCTLPLLFVFMDLPDVGARSVLYGGVLRASCLLGRIGLLPGALLEPPSPVLPPRALVLLGVLAPLLGGLVALALPAGPVAVALLWR